MYVAIQVYLPLKTVNQILEISKSIYYDQQKEVLTVRCHDMAPSIATLWLALQVATQRLTVDQIERQGLYGRMVVRAMEDKIYKKELEGDVFQMVDVLNSEKPKSEEC